MSHEFATRGVTARKLRQNSNREVIKTIVQEQVKIIDAKVQTAHDSGLNFIKYDLPTTFSIMGFKKDDAQIMIWSELLVIYGSPDPKGKGFNEVYIEPHGNSAFLWIKWLNGMDEDERTRRRNLIKSHLRNE